MPATDDPAKDLEIFLKLMAMDDDAFARRFDGSATEFARLFPAWADLVTEERSADGGSMAGATLTNDDREARDCRGIRHPCRYSFDHG